MSLMGIIIGTFHQLAFAYFLFMLAAFAGGGVANGRSLTKVELKIVNLALFVLPGLCVVSAIIVIVLYCLGGSGNSYWWHLLPVAATAAYLIYVCKFLS